MTEETETFLAKIAKGWRVTIYEPIRDSLDLNIGDLLRVTVSLKKKMPPRASPPKIEAVPEAEIEAVPEAVPEAEPEAVPEAEPVPEIEAAPVPETEALEEPNELEIPAEVIEVEEITTISGAEEIVTFDIDVDILGDEEVILELCPKNMGKPLENLTICVMQDCEYFNKILGKLPECTYKWTSLEEDVDTPDPGDGYCPHHFDKIPEDLEECSALNCPNYRRQYGENPTRCVWPGWTKEAKI